MKILQKNKKATKNKTKKLQMKTKIKKLRKKPIKLACERNGIKNEIYRKTYTNNIFKYNINIINNSMFINLWMVGHKCSTKFS